MKFLKFNMFHCVVKCEQYKIQILYLFIDVLLLLFINPILGNNESLLLFPVHFLTVCSHDPDESAKILPNTPLLPYIIVIQYCSRLNFASNYLAEVVEKLKFYFNPYF